MGNDPEKGEFQTARQLLELEKHVLLSFSLKVSMDQGLKHPRQFLQVEISISRNYKIPLIVKIQN